MKSPRFTAAELDEAMRTRNDIPLLDVVVTAVLFLVPPLALYLYSSIWTGVIGIIVNIHVFNRCAQIVHGSDHNALFASKKLDLIIGRLAGYLLGYQKQGHKEAHDEHHLFLNSEKDADRVWCEPEARVRSMLSGWLRDLLLVSAAYRFWQYIPSRRSDGGTPARGSSLTGAMNSFAPIVAIQLVMVFVYVGAARFNPTLGIAYYLLVYIAPLFVLYPMQIRLRSNVEHSFLPGYQCITVQDRRVVRSVKASWVERMIIAPLRGDYHYEHHLFPRMPYYNAPRVRQMLLNKGFSIPLAQGYLYFVWRKWRAERAIDQQSSST